MGTAINLDNLELDYFSDKPTKVWDHSPQKIFYDYRLFAHLDGQDVGHLTISVIHFLQDKRQMDNFWYDLSKKPAVIRPVVVFQNTKPQYRGNGVSGKLILIANDFSKRKFGQTLSSDTTFCSNPNCYWGARGYSERPALRVWEKLQADGFALYIPYLKNPRWVMK